MRARCGIISLCRSERCQCMHPAAAALTATIATQLSNGVHKREQDKCIGHTVYVAPRYRQAARVSILRRVQHRSGS
jgi:hypothetical protein